MNIAKYIEFVINDKLIHKWSWVTALIGIQRDGVNNQYIQIDDNVGYVKINDENIIFDGYVKNNAFIRIGDSLTISKDSLACLDKDVTTTMGRFIINYLLIEVPFKGTLKYLDGDINLGMIISIVKDALSDDVITVDEYRDFVWSCTYLESFNKLVTPSSTSKLLTPPPGLSAFKKKLRAKMVTDYGDNWSEDPSRVVAYDTALKGYYSEYIQDDPSNGVLADNKNKNNALAKKYLTFSATNAFGEQVHIDESLEDGYPTDPEKLAAMFNTIRSASYSRGAETQKGGAVAKSVLRATSSITISMEDCGVKYGKSLIIDESNRDSMLGRYVITNGKVTSINKDNVDKYVGSTVEIRSPMYCHAKNPGLCRICVGDKAGSHKNGVSLIVTNISSVLTTSALKAMHNSQIATVKISLDDMVV